MHRTTRLHERQIWNLPTYTSGAVSYCTPVTLPASGIISFGPDNVVTLSAPVVFQPLCTSVADAANATSLHSPHHFYASATPQVFVVAAATVLAWVLVIMLLISPRTYLNNFGSGPAPISVGRGIIGGANGGTASAAGMGSRPWLQKAAALTVAIALTIATADTFIVSERHYPAGIDGNSMRALVENSIEIRITRTISDIFVWLAQVQTLIRLFPRHKEKVLIKWIGFALIVLETTFACLNSFMHPNYRRPREFEDAIPALSYLFELALSLLYAAWVVYYVLTKARYAFYHPKMKTVSLIAGLSVVAILTPVVFFVTDITLPEIAGWGDYFRWVGAAAASVIVWEWVERIELLERDEKKDGILGREVFDGDEMLDIPSSDFMTYNGGRNDSYTTRKGGSRGGGASSGGQTHRFHFHGHSPFNRKRHTKPTPPHLERETVPSMSSEDPKLSSSSSEFKDKEDLWSLPHRRHEPRLSPPPPTVSPPSRTDTTSAASTVYVVRHDDNANIQPVRRRVITPEINNGQQASAEQDDTGYEVEAKSRKAPTAGWHVVSNPFKRKRTTPPAEVRAAIRASQDVGQATATSHGLKVGPKSNVDLMSKIGGFASRSQSKWKEKASQKAPEVELPWTVIPAQPRGVTWSPPVSNEEAGASDTTGSPAQSRQRATPANTPSPHLTRGDQSGRRTASLDVPPTPPPKDSASQGTLEHSIDARIRQPPPEGRQDDT